MLLCICLVIDHKRCQNMVRTSVTRAEVFHFFLTHFNITNLFDLLLKKCTVTCDLFAKVMTFKTKKLELLSLT